MHHIPSRSEKHFEQIQKFIVSDLPSLTLRLYNQEISRLTKEFPISIEKIKEFENKLYECTITRK